MVFPGFVIGLAYVAAAAVIIPAVFTLATGRAPGFLRRRANGVPRRARIEGAGLLLIGVFILADVLAVDLGRRSSVPGTWILLVWVLLAAGLIGIRYLSGRTSTPTTKPSA